MKQEFKEYKQHRNMHRVPYIFTNNSRDPLGNSKSDNVPSRMSEEESL